MVAAGRWPVKGHGVDEITGKSGEVFGHIFRGLDPEIQERKDYLLAGLSNGRQAMWTARCATVVAALVLVFASVGHSRTLAGPIHDAAKAGDAAKVDALIAAGTNVDEKDVASRTALHWAADIGHIDVVELLIAKGATIDAKDVTDDTPLHLAVLSNHEDVVKLLIDNGANVNALDADGVAALDDAVRLGYPDMIDALKSAGAECGTSQQFSDRCKQAME